MTGGGNSCRLPGNSCRPHGIFNPILISSVHALGQFKQDDCRVFMKIIRTGQVTRQPAVGRKRAKSTGGDRFTISAGAETHATAAATPAGPLTAVDSLLALQEVGRRNGSRARAVKQGHDILDRLDEIRHALLMGTISRQRLATIAQLVRTRREEIDDPALIEIMDDIELRAEVELAKLSRFD